MTTIHQLSAQFKRLPVTAENRGVFEALLSLPFDLFRPTMDMLLDGTLVVEDLLPASGLSVLAATQAAALQSDSNAASQRAKMFEADINAVALVKNVQAVLAGYRSAAVPIPRDTSVLTIDTTGGPSGAYSPAGMNIIGPDAFSATPSPIELIRAALRGEDARKIAQRALAGKRPSELD